VKKETFILMLYIKYFFKLLLYGCAYGSLYKARNLIELELVNQMQLEQIRLKQEELELKKKGL